MLSTAELNEVAKQVTVWAKRNEAIIQLGAALEQLGSLTQAADEARAAKTIAEAERAAADADLLTTKAALATLRKDIEREQSVATLRAEKQRADLADAERKFQKESQETRAALVADIGIEMASMKAKAQSELDHLRANIVSAGDNLSRIEAARARAAQELEAINAKLEQAKAAVKAALA
jgi:chromosome segregation ATPase